jgi:NAD(P)-dependent dehydrogenase (short-subunit alcohol dehydrogenase family)
MGANGGIGASLSEKLLLGGGRVALGCRDEDKMANLVDRLCAGPAGASAKDRIFAVKVDATVPAEVEACVKDVLKNFGRIDGAANCVGSIVLKGAHSTSEEEFEQTLRTNLFSSFSLLRNLARPMMKQKSGSIVFCSSAVASIGLSNHEAIAAAKAGVEGLALSAASTYARFGIRVNVVAPGLTNTPLAAKITGNEAALKASVAMHPLGRIGEAEESASAIHFLLNHNYITGQVLGVDGGLSSLK